MRAPFAHLLTSLLLLAASAGAGDDAATAFMAGSFDMPTKAHIALMRSALNEPGTGRLVLMVNTLTGPRDYTTKDFYTSFAERKEMILRSLGADAARVTIVPEPPQGYAGVLSELQARGTSQIRIFIGEDLYRGKMTVPPGTEYRVVLRPGQAGAYPHEEQPHVAFWAQDGADGISSSRGRALILAGRFDELAAIVDPKVVALIQEKGLYQAPTGAVLHRREAQYRAAFRQFKSLYLFHVPREFSIPPFNPAQSPDAWANKFEQHFDAFIQRSPGMPPFCILHFSLQVGRSNRFNTN